MKTCIMVYGLPGSGKTELSSRLAKETGWNWYNADRVRATLSKDLGFSELDRLEQARRMAAVGALSLDSVDNVILDFVNPTNHTHMAFLTSFHQYTKESSQVYLIHMDTILPEKSRFADTVAMFQPNRDYQPDVIVRQWITSDRHWNNLVAYIAELPEDVPEIEPTQVIYRSNVFHLESRIKKFIPQEVK